MLHSEKVYRWSRYGVAVAAVVVALLCSLAIKPLIVGNPFLLFFAAITISAWYGGMGPGLLATVLSLLLSNYFLIVPYNALALDTHTLIRIFFFVLVSTLITLLSTQRKKAQELLQVTLASIGDAVITTTMSGDVSFLNGAAEQLTGWSSSEAYGRHISEVFPLVNETTHEVVENPVGKVLETGAVVGLANHTLLLARDGREIPIADSAAPIRDMAGRVYGVVIVFRDMREQHSTEELRARYSAIVESSQDAIIGKSMDGIIETWNAAAQQLYGYGPEEVIGRHISMLAPAERRDEIQQILARLRQGEKVPSFETVRVRKDGRRIDVSLTISPIRDSTGRLLGASTIARDITQPARAARSQRFLSEASALLASSLDEIATLRTLAELAISYLGDWCRIDMLGGDGQLHEVAIVHADPSKIALARELERRYPPQLDAPHGRQQVARTGRAEFYPQVDEAMMRSMARDEAHLRLLNEIGPRSLMLVPLKSAQQTLGVISFVSSESGHHYTEQDFETAQELARRAAIALENAQLYHVMQQASLRSEASRERIVLLQHMTAALSGAITQADVTRVIVEHASLALGASKAALGCLTDDGSALALLSADGLALGELEQLGHLPLETPIPLAQTARTGQAIYLESPEDYQRFPALLGQGQQDGGAQALASLPLVVHERVTGALGFTFPRPRRFSDEAREFFMAVARQCAQALERAQLYQQTQDAVRMRDQFLALAAHELKTPTTTILGSAQLIQRQLERSEHSSERDRSRVRTLVDQVHRLYRLIGLLLDLSRIQDGRLTIEREPVDLREIGSQIVEEIQPTLLSHTIELSAPQEECLVLGDRLRLEQVFQNLLQNAVKYSPEGGCVSIALARSDGMIYCAVQDGGIGIPRDAQARIFDRFYRAPNVNIEQLSGMGIGLYVVKEIVSLHGGSIAVESDEGQGATFTVGLPAYEAEGRRHEATGEA